MRPEIGARIERYRLQQNRTLQEIADATGLTLLTIHNVERGKNPTLGTVIRILRALNRIDALESFLPAPLVSPLELVQIELAGADAEEVAGAARLEHAARLAERLPEGRHVDLNRLRRRARDLVRPERLGKPVGGHDLVGVQEQEREDGPLPRGAEVERLSVARHLEWPQHPELHEPTLLGRSGFTQP